MNQIDMYFHWFHNASSIKARCLYTTLLLHTGHLGLLAIVIVILQLLQNGKCPQSSIYPDSKEAQQYLQQNLLSEISFLMSLVLIFLFVLL